MKKLTLIFVFFWVLGSFPIASASVLISPDYFGMHVGRIIQNDTWRKSPIGAIRLHDNNVSWRDLEITRGQWDFSRLDKIVGAVKEKNLPITLVLQTTPQWASSKPDEIGAYGLGANSVPKDIGTWREYITQVVTRYKGKIDFYEMWNEPNLIQFFKGSPSELADLTNVACSVIRDVDPGAKIVSAAATGDYGVKWWGTYLQKVQSNCLDVLGYHFYTKNGPPEDIYKINDLVRLAAKNSGYGSLPIWNTESGWLIKQKGSSANPNEVGFKATDRLLDNAEAINYLVRAYIIGLDIGLGRFYWYQWDNAQMGITSERGKEKNEVTRAFDLLVDLLSGSTLKQCASDNGVYQCLLYKKDSRIVQLIWSRIGSSRIEVKGGSRITFGPWSEGCSQSLKTGELLRISESPVVVCN